MPPPFYSGHKFTRSLISQLTSANSHLADRKTPDRSKHVPQVLPQQQRRGAQWVRVGAQWVRRGQSWRLLPTRSGRPGSGGGSAAGLRAMTSALVWCSVQSPLVGVARDTPSPERNKTGRGPGAPSRGFRRAFPPARRAASCQFQDAELGRRQEMWGVPEDGLLCGRGSVRRQQLP